MTESLRFSLQIKLLLVYKFPDMNLRAFTHLCELIQ